MPSLFIFYAMEEPDYYCQMAEEFRVLLVKRNEWRRTDLFFFCYWSSIEDQFLNLHIADSAPLAEVIKSAIEEGTCGYCVMATFIYGKKTAHRPPTTPNPHTPTHPHYYNFQTVNFTFF